MCRKKDVPCVRNRMLREGLIDAWCTLERSLLEGFPIPQIDGAPDASARLNTFLQNCDTIKRFCHRLFAIPWICKLASIWLNLGREASFCDEVKSASIDENYQEPAKIPNYKSTHQILVKTDEKTALETPWKVNLNLVKKPTPQHDCFWCTG